MAFKLRLVVGMQWARQKNPKVGERYFLPVKTESSLPANK